MCFNHSFFEIKNFYTTASAGVNYSVGTKRGDYIFGAHSNWLGGGMEYYQLVNFSLIGMDMDIRETWKMYKNLGLELTVFANLNPEKNNYGVLLGIAYSYPFNNKLKK